MKTTAPALRPFADIPNTAEYALILVARDSSRIRAIVTKGADGCHYLANRITGTRIFLADYVGWVPSTLNRRPHLSGVFRDAAGVLCQSFAMLRDGYAVVICDTEDKAITRFLSIDTLPPGASQAFRARVESILKDGPAATWTPGTHDPIEPAPLPVLSG